MSPAVLVDLAPEASGLIFNLRFVSSDRSPCESVTHIRVSEEEARCALHCLILELVFARRWSRGCR
jgi:hypothetical protein